MKASKYPAEEIRGSEGEAVMTCRNCGSRRETSNGVVPKVCLTCGSGNFNVVVPKMGGRSV